MLLREMGEDLDFPPELIDQAECIYQTTGTRSCPEDILKMTSLYLAATENGYPVDDPIVTREEIQDTADELDIEVVPRKSGAFIDELIAELNEEHDAELRQDTRDLAFEYARQAPESALPYPMAVAAVFLAAKDVENGHPIKYVTLEQMADVSNYSSDRVFDLTGKLSGEI